MKGRVWHSMNTKTWGWRQHKPWEKRLNIENQTKEEALKKAIEILKRHREILNSLPYKIDFKKWYWRNPFPPRNNK